MYLDKFVGSDMVLGLYPASTFRRPLYSHKTIVSSPLG